MSEERVRIEYEEDAEGISDSHEGKPSKPSTTAMPPNGGQRVLLHSCCAPCSGAMIEEMRATGLDIAVFF